MSFQLTNHQMIERIAVVVQRIAEELPKEHEALPESDDDQWLSDELEVTLRTCSAVLVALEARRKLLKKALKNKRSSSEFYPDKTAGTEALHLAKQETPL